MTVGSGMNIPDVQYPYLCNLVTAWKNASTKKYRSDVPGLMMPNQIVATQTLGRKFSGTFCEHRDRPPAHTLFYPRPCFADCFRLYGIIQHTAWQ